jgi:hypothetical protein
MRRSLPAAAVDDERLRDAADNALAVASISWQQSVHALRYTLQIARDHGLSDDELAAASGLPRSFIAELLEEAG